MVCPLEMVPWVAVDAYVDAYHEAEDAECVSKELTTPIFTCCLFRESA